MTAPDPDAESLPGYTPLSPEALAGGQRTLAAIVFTDTVGFSALMRKNEELALRLVARDLEQMKATCAAYGGQVLKSTGDGLLMLFTSAVQAVACALEIQREIDRRNPELPPEERLQHRIGIHLGDVFQHGGDVMGDGVNVAARLQTEAVPGGICLSNTVFDVVNNRLPFYVNDLGARKLKNIGTVTAYQISPMEGSAGTRRIGIAWYHYRPWIWRGAFLLGIIALVVIAFNWGSQYRHQLYLKTHPNAQKAASAPVNTATVSIAPPANPLPVPAATPVVQPEQPVITDATETEFQDAEFTYLMKYDFDGMEQWMKEHDWPGKNNSPLIKACPQLNHLVTWCHQQLQKYTFDKPLKVIGNIKTFYFWPAPFNGLRMKWTQNGVPLAPNTQATLLGGGQIQPGMMLLIAHELIKEDALPSDALTAQLNQELHLFMQTYNVNLPNRKPAQAKPAELKPAGPNPSTSGAGTSPLQNE